MWCCWWFMWNPLIYFVSKLGNTIPLTRSVGTADAALRNRIAYEIFYLRPYLPGMTILFIYRTLELDRKMHPNLFNFANLSFEQPEMWFNWILPIPNGKFRYPHSTVWTELVELESNVLTRHTVSTKPRKLWRWFIFCVIDASKLVMWIPIFVSRQKGQVLIRILITWWRIFEHHRETCCA